ncbi:hypothetical protein LTR85_009592 [Meristemomyces frigidus]|nr:hypothetical protein LTR85_009592 [Meristemomyces frigidus]
MAQAKYDDKIETKSGRQLDDLEPRIVHNARAGFAGDWGSTRSAYKCKGPALNCEISFAKWMPFAQKTQESSTWIRRNNNPSIAKEVDAGTTSTGKGRKGSKATTTAPATKKRKAPADRQQKRARARGDDLELADEEDDDFAELASDAGRSS